MNLLTKPDNEVNDTWLKYTPEIGYPVAKRKRRRRIAAPEPDAGEPRRDVAVRWALYTGAGACFIGAAAWVVGFFV